VFTAPRHPYTALLLAALPRLDDLPKSHLAVIDGLVPSPGAFPPGCRFADRCPLADDHCRTEIPPLRDVGDGHLSACWHTGQVHTMSAA
jgi:peptide/nickel transport system ATP-binding protein